MNQGMWVALETGSGKEADSPLEPQKWVPSCKHLDFGLVRPVLDF